MWVRVRVDVWVCGCMGESVSMGVGVCVSEAALGGTGAQGAVRKIGNNRASIFLPVLLNYLNLYSKHITFTVGKRPFLLCPAEMVLRVCLTRPSLTSESQRT